MSDKIREIQSRFRNIHGSDQIAAAAAYIPLFGWIFAYYVKKEIELCRFHGRQAMQLNGVMLVVYFAVWVLEHFPIVSFFFGPGQWFHAITRAVWLVTALAFAGLSAYAAFKAFSEEKWAIPQLDENIQKAIDHVKNG